VSGQYKQSTSTAIGGGLRVDQFEGDTELSPFVNVSVTGDKSNLKVEAYKRSLFYEKLSCGSFTERYAKYGLEVSGGLEFSDQQSLWYSVDAGYIDDSNVEVVSQYNFVFFKDKYMNNVAPIHYELAIDGYYVWNRKQMDDYYSPEFFDSTVLSMNPTFNIGHKFNLLLQSSIGYSFGEKSMIFRYGLWGEYLLRKGLKIKAGCERSNIGSSSAGGSHYNYNHCLVSMGYEW
jgi:hypothetical protein